MLPTVSSPPVTATVSPTPSDTEPVSTGVTIHPATLPLSFEPNVGQTDARVRYLVHGPGYSLFLTDSEAALSITQAPPPTHERFGRPDPHDILGPLGGPGQGVISVTAPLTRTVVRLHYTGMNPTPRVTAEEPLPGRVNYLLGANAKGWKTDIATYARITYHAVYPGVDLSYYGTQGRLEYDWTVTPGASVAAIAYTVLGAARQ